MLKIGIDVQSTVGQKTGIGHYTHSLVAGIKKADIVNSYYFYKGAQISNVPGRMLWEQVRLPMLAKRDRLDLLHSPGFSPPRLRHCKVVTTVHDLIGMLFPHNLASVSRFYWSRWLPYAVKSSDRIIANSQNTKNDIVRLLKVNPGRIKVIYLGIDEHFRPSGDSEKERIKKKYNLPQRYILYVGTIEPRKNLGTLVLAFDKARRKAAHPHKLVIAGAKGWSYESLLSLVKRTNLDEDVIFIGYVDDEDRPALYSGADLFIFPSLYEGFGLPVLEAMACGVPVITSNVSSIPEVAGDAGILFEPNSVDELALAIERVLGDDGLKEELKQKGLARAKDFSLEKMAKETIEVYQN